MEILPFVAEDRRVWYTFVRSRAPGCGPGCTGRSFIDSSRKKHYTDYKSLDFSIFFNILRLKSGNSALPG